MIPRTFRPTERRVKARLATLCSGALGLMLLGTMACAVRKPQIHTYRLVRTDASEVLVPPGVINPDIAQQTFNANVAHGPGRCHSSPGSIAIERTKKRTRVTVTREMLLHQPAGWLNEWTADLESQGCIAPGAGPRLARQIAEALPLDTNQAFHLLYSNQIDITPQMRIQVVSPILREGGAIHEPILRSVERSGNGNSITTTLKSAADLIGYEMAWYSVRAKADGLGLSIVPLYADRHIEADTERRSQPAINYFQLSQDAAFYRVFYEAKQTEYAALIIGAPTRAELERRSKILGTGAASCKRLNDELCVAVPKQVAINALVPVTVNGGQLWVNWGNNVGGVIRAAGERQANLVLPKLIVQKLYDGKVVAVHFDHTSPVILNLIVTGGEVMSWK